VASPASNASRALGASDGAPHNNAPAAKAAGEAIAITVRDDFLLELGDALGGQASITPVDSLERALGELAGARRVQVLAIDARDAVDLRGDVDRAHAEAPTAPVLVFAPAESEKSVGATLKGSSVFAVLAIPVDRRKTAAVFDGALTDAAARRAAARPSGGMEMDVELRSPLSVEPMPMRAAPEPGPGSSQLVKIGIGAALAVVALAGGGYFYFAGSAKHASTPAAHVVVSPAAAPTAGAGSTAAPAAPTVAEVPLVKGTVDELLEKARLAMRERRFTEPGNDCALLYYRSVLGMDAANGEAKDGMTRLATLLSTRFDESLSAGKYDDAAGALAGLKLANPHDAKVSALETRLLQVEISKALADGNLDRATALLRQAQQSGSVSADQLTKWRTELTRRQDDARIKHASDLVAERIRDGHLTDPDNDNAKYYWQQLKEIAPSNPAVQRTTKDLIAAYLHKARDATLAGHTSESDRWVGEAKAAGLAAADLASWQHEVSAARQKAVAAEVERLSQLVRDRIRDGHLTDPAQDSAVFYAGQLKDGFADSAATTTAARELVGKLLERAGTAARSGQTAQMDSDLAAARRWGADPTDIQRVQLLAANRGASSGGQQARAGSAGPTGVKLKRVRNASPEYPQKALDAHISGSVTVEFTVDLKGTPRDARVVDSTPPGVFDSAALAAVSRWRFEPVILNNVPTEVPTRTSIRFELPK
jgi:protein TonB